MGCKVQLCSSVFPSKNHTLPRIGIDVEDAIDTFVQSIGRNEMLPFLGIYQRMAYSYHFLLKLVKQCNPDFILVTGGSTIIPRQVAHKTILYIHYPADIELSRESYLNNKLKKLYVKPWRFISENLDGFKDSTLIANSNFTRDAIRKAWDMDSAVIYPPCPLYSFDLDLAPKQDTVCSIGRFTPEKRYEIILQIAGELPHLNFELVGLVTNDKIHYLEELRRIAPSNVKFHVNISVEEKESILMRSKALLHSFVGEHFGIGLVEAMSAGVIPVTHNSGAPKIDGLVDAKYRYDDIGVAVDHVQHAVSTWTPKEAMRLRTFASKFSVQTFRESIKSFISDWLAQKKMV